MAAVSWPAQFGHDARERIARDRLSLTVSLVVGASFLIQASLILVSWGNLPPEVPIFYSLPWGEYLASPLALWILPLSAFLTFSFNMWLAEFPLRQNVFLGRTLILSALVAAGITLYGTVKIVTLLI